MKTQQHARQFASEAHACAIQMMENAAYIQKELPALDMPDSLRARIDELCAELMGTKHDLSHEVGVLEDFLALEPGQVAPRMDRIHRWLLNQTCSLNQCVAAVNQSVQSGVASPMVATS